MTSFPVALHAGHPPIECGDESHNKRSQQSRLSRPRSAVQIGTGPGYGAAVECRMSIEGDDGAKRPPSGVDRMIDEFREARSRRSGMRGWMMLLESVRTWRRRATPVSEPPRTIPRLERTEPHVPAEYLSLYRYLEHRYASCVVLTFEQMEALLGFGLPASAYTEPGWWTEAAVPTGYSAAWTGARRTATPNLPARTVTFERRA